MKPCCACLSFALALWHLVGAGPGLAQTVDPASQQDAETTEAQGEKPVLGIKVSTLQVYDSNIDHDEHHRAAYGLVPGAQVRFQNRARSPVLTLQYQVARHAYTRTDKWDRVSNKFRVTFTPEGTRRWRTETDVELSFGGTSEDRDISNQYALEQNVEYRFTRDHRLHFFTYLRLKRIVNNPAESAIKPYWGLVYERKTDDDGALQLSARYELNREQEARGDYSRWTYALDYEIPLFKTENVLTFEAKYQRKNYAFRFVEVEDEDERRRYYQWAMSVDWERPLIAGLIMRFQYQYELRDSNDPGKRFTAHLLQYQLVYGR